MALQYVDFPDPAGPITICPCLPMTTGRVDADADAAPAVEAGAAAAVPLMAVSGWPAVVRVKRAEDESIGLQL